MELPAGGYSRRDRARSHCADLHGPDQRWRRRRRESGVEDREVAERDAARRAARIGLLLVTRRLHSRRNKPQQIGDQRHAGREVERDNLEAAGTYHLGHANVAMAEAWNGGRWSWQHVPVPVGSDSAGLNSVSCTTARFCEAVGSFQGSLGTALLAARWNGITWRLQHAPSPAGAQFEEFSAVSCTSATFCEAWGGGNSGNPGPAVAERWNGRSWRMQAVPSNAPVNSVSCVSVTFCEAVGSGPSAVAWNGTAWSVQSASNPPQRPSRT